MSSGSGSGRNNELAPADGVSPGAATRLPVPNCHDDDSNLAPTNPLLASSPKQLAPTTNTNPLAAMSANTNPLAAMFDRRQAAPTTNTNPLAAMSANTNPLVAMSDRRQAAPTNTNPLAAANRNPLASMAAPSNTNPLANNTNPLASMAAPSQLAPANDVPVRGSAPAPSRGHYGAVVGVNGRVEQPRAAGPYSQNAFMELSGQNKGAQKKELRHDITLEEVGKHAHRRDCWMALHGNVYDVTDYLRYHPGGTDVLKEHHGKDATQAFDEVHSYINYRMILKDYHVGTLKHAPRSMGLHSLNPEPPAPIQRGGVTNSMATSGTRHSLGPPASSAHSLVPPKITGGGGAKGPGFIPQAGPCGGLESLAPPQTAADRRKGPGISAPRPGLALKPGTHPAFSQVVKVDASGNEVAPDEIQEELPGFGAREIVKKPSTDRVVDHANTSPQ